MVLSAFDQIARRNLNEADVRYYVTMFEEVRILLESCGVIGISFDEFADYLKKDWEEYNAFEMILREIGAKLFREGHYSEASILAAKLTSFTKMKVNIHLRDFNAALESMPHLRLLSDVDVIPIAVILDKKTRAYSALVRAGIVSVGQAIRLVKANDPEQLRNIRNFSTESFGDLKDALVKHGYIES